MTQLASTDDRLRVGLIGHGRIGRVHAANVAAHPRADLVAVHDALADNAQAAAQRYGCRVVGSPTELIEDTEVDAVVIASPTPTHVDYLQASVLAGKATLCEKPIDLDIAKVEACKAVLDGRDVPVMIGFHRRFDPSHRAIHAAAADGEIGNVETLRLVARDPALPPLDYIAVSGGQPRDMTIHDLDVVRWLLPDEPAAVAAMGSVLAAPDYAEHQDTDTLHILIRTAAGRIAHIDNVRRTAYGFDQRLELFGADGALEMTNRRPTSVERSDATGTQRRGRLVHGFIDRYAEAYAAEMDHFVSCALSGTTPDVGFEDGRRALIMADAVLESLRHDRFVDIDFGST